MKKLKVSVAAILLGLMMVFPAYAGSFDISPSRDNTPVMETLPDPNDPDSPERVIIMDGDTPLAYVKFETPEGIFIYILETEVPLARITSPQTGYDENADAAGLALVAGIGCAVLLAAPIRKKRDPM